MKKLLTILLILPAMLGCTSTGTSSKKQGKNAENKPGEEEQQRTDPGAYVFAYFTGNGPGEEAIRFAVSPDGFNYRALNNNEPIISSEKISTSGGVRDPHLLRGKDGDTFYMVATDLYVPGMGWRNYAMVLMKSDDLIHWTSSIVNIPDTFPEFSDVYRVWAPQTIYDKRAGKYMIYFSMLQPGSYDKIYYAYANEDFTGLESAPRQLFHNPGEFATIDADIVKKDGKFHLFYKTEGENKGIAKAVSDSLIGDYKIVSNSVDRTNQAVEGSGTFKLNNSETYILMYDLYTSGRYQFTKSTDLKNFTIIDQDISMDFHPRHGSVLPLTMEEGKRLVRQWGSPSIMVFLQDGAE